MTVHSALYRGELAHARTDDRARRAFRYGVYMAALDLDEFATLDARLHLFSHDRPNLFAFRDRDYAAGESPSTGAPSRDLRAELAALRAANGLAVPHATRLVTNLRAFGYLFNPVSFFVDYDAAGEVIGAIAEVNNTYGGHLRYVLGPAHRIAGGFRHTRELYVSPFLPGALTYEFYFAMPLDGDALAVEMRVLDATERQVFYARFSGTRAPLTDRTLAVAALRYPFMTAQVIGLIHWQALKLRLAGVPYLRPLADHRPRSGPP